MADEEESKRRVLKTRSGARIRSPRPMTADEWFDFKMSEEFDKLRERAEKTRESERLTGLPSYLLLDSVFGNVGQVVEVRNYPSVGRDQADRDITLSRVRADEQRKERGLPSNITTCQARNSDGRPISPAVAERLRGYRRVMMFPDTNAGKRHAKRAQAEIRENCEGDCHVRVLRVYCHDTEPRGYHWTVWVKGIDWNPETGYPSRMGMVRQYGTEEGGGAARQGEQWQQNVGEGRAWMADRTAAKNAVECPKCGAPAGDQCTTQAWPDGSKTNAHKPRVFAFYDAEGREAPAGSKSDRLGAGHGGYD